MKKPLVLAAGSLLVLLATASCSLQERHGTMTAETVGARTPAHEEKARDGARRASGGRVERWGSMAEALRDGHTEGRVALSQVVARRNAYAVGVLAGLKGEVTVCDGEIWISRASSPSEVRTSRGRTSDAQATMLASALVSRWKDVAVERDVPPAELDGFIRRCADRVGLNGPGPFPFLVEGELLSLKMHVIAGECPIRARMLGKTMTSPPYEFSSPALAGRLFGIYAENSEGVLTHMGSRTHTHAVIDDEKPLTGHVEAVGIQAGSTLRLPALRLPAE